MGGHVIVDQCIQWSAIRRPTISLFLGPIGKLLGGAGSERKVVARATIFCSKCAERRFTVRDKFRPYREFALQIRDKAEIIANGESPLGAFSAESGRPGDDFPLTSCTAKQLPNRS